MSQITESPELPLTGRYVYIFIYFYKIHTLPLIIDDLAAVKPFLSSYHYHLFICHLMPKQSWVSYPRKQHTLIISIPDYNSGLQLFLAPFADSQMTPLPRRLRLFCTIPVLWNIRYTKSCRSICRLTWAHIYIINLALTKNSGCSFRYVN